MSGNPWVLVSGDFTPLGGMDRANHGLASYLARSGGEVRLVTHRAWDDLEALPNLHVHRVPRPWGKHSLGEPLLDRAGRREAKRAGGGARVVVNGGNCLWGDVNWVHYVHAAWSPKTSGPLVRRLKAAVTARRARRHERACLERARVVVANSERTRRDLIERVGLSPERVHTVYYGADPSRFRPASPSERDEARARLGWDDRPVLAFVGALGDLRKGFDTLLNAWHRLAARGNWDARLAVLGAGAALPHWTRRAGELGLAGSVEFLGFRSDVPDVLKGVDALVSPTRYEAYGLNVHEALCCGLPALVSRSAGVAERFPPELEHLLIPDPDDAEALAERLLLWRDRRGDDAPAVADLSERLRARTWDDMAREFVAVTGGTATNAPAPAGTI